MNAGTNRSILPAFCRIGIHSVNGNDVDIVQLYSRE